MRMKGLAVASPESESIPLNMYILRTRLLDLYSWGNRNENLDTLLFGIETILVVSYLLFYENN